MRIVGAGALGTGLARALSSRGRRVELYTRGWQSPDGTPQRDGRRCEIRGRAWNPAVAPGRAWPSGVAVRSLSTLAAGRSAFGPSASGTSASHMFASDTSASDPSASDPSESNTSASNQVPIVLCLSSAERATIAAAIAGGATEVPRSAVARASVEALERDLPWSALAGAPVLVVTNPVELACELVARRTGNPDVLGFGMATDRERIAEALMRGFGETAPPDLELTGLHARRAIPLFSAELAARLAESNPDAVRARLAATPGPYDALGRAAELFDRLLPKHMTQATRAHELVHTVVRAITVAEFDGPRPPVARPVAVLARQVDGWLTGAADAPAEVSGAVVRHGARVFLGGRVTSAGFASREPGALEADLLESELAAHLEQVRDLLGEPP